MSRSRHRNPAANAVAFKVPPVNHAQLTHRPAIPQHHLQPNSPITFTPIPDRFLLDGFSAHQRAMRSTNRQLAVTLSSPVNTRAYL